jgi:sarcosine oxidase subunit beta
VALPRSVDVVIVGGGAVGVSIAYHLAAAGAGRVLLVEREPGLGLGSTGRCAGGFRHQFSSEVNVRLSIESVRMLKAFSADHGLPLDLHADGYLFLCREAATWQAYQAGAAMQRDLGEDVRLLSAPEAGQLVPGLAVGDAIGATYCPDDGIADPAGLTNGYAIAARRAGAHIETGLTATSIRSSGNRVAGIETSAGSIDAPVVVNAAGVWAPALAATAGVDLPIEPLPRHIAVTAPFDGRPERRTLVIEAETTFYFHREGGGVLMGMPKRGEHTTFDTAVDQSYIAEELLPKAVEMFPPLEDASLATTWVGLYEMTPDRHPILGPVSAVPGLYVAAGFSGHGFQHAPIVGKLIAEQIVDGEATTVGISSLRLDRFADRAAVTEQHVV